MNTENTTEQEGKNDRLFVPKQYPMSLEAIDNMDQKSKEEIFLKEQILEEIFQDFPYEKINVI